MEKELEVNNLKLNTQEQEALRFKIVRCAKKQFESGGELKFAMIAEICECSERHVRNTWKRYKEGGIAAVKAKKMGRPKDSGKLSPKQQKEVRGLIVDKDPNQLKLKGFLWDRENVQKLIKQKYDITIALSNIGKYLKSWGMTPQRPITKSYKQQPEQVQKWLDEEYPKIKQRAKIEQAEILWGDE